VPGTITDSVETFGDEGMSKVIATPLRQAWTKDYNHECNGDNRKAIEHTMENKREKTITSSTDLDSYDFTSIHMRREKPGGTSWEVTYQNT
jgi:hypothetical protein